MENDVFPWEDDDEDLFFQSNKQSEIMLHDTCDMLLIINWIVDIVSRSGSVTRALNDASTYIKRFSDALNIPQESALFPAFFVEHFCADSIGTPLISIAEDIECSITDLMRYFGHIQYLVDNGYIVKRGTGIYIVPDEVLVALSENRPYNGLDYYKKVLLFTAEFITSAVLCKMNLSW